MAELKEKKPFYEKTPAEIREDEAMEKSSEENVMVVYDSSKDLPVTYLDRVYCEVDEDSKHPYSCDIFEYDMPTRTFLKHSVQVDSVEANRGIKTWAVESKGENGKKKVLYRPSKGLVYWYVIYPYHGEIRLEMTNLKNAALYKAMGLRLSMISKKAYLDKLREKYTVLEHMEPNVYIDEG